MAFRIIAFAVAIGLSASWSTADDTVESLKLKLEQLEAKLTLADKTIELLQKQCDLLEKENSQLKRMESGKPDSGGKPAKEPENPVDDGNDLFRVGVVWVGEAKLNNRPGKWALSISQRNGKDLTGGVIAVGPEGKKTEFPVTGSAPASGNGLVVLETPLIGRAKMFLRGRLQNGEIAFAVSGTGALGDKLIGAATLRPKN